MIQKYEKKMFNPILHTQNTHTQSTNKIIPSHDMKLKTWNLNVDAST